MLHVHILCCKGHVLLL